MSGCSKCIFKPFCQSPGPACSSFKDKDRCADRDEVIREFAERLKHIIGFDDLIPTDCVMLFPYIDNLVKEMTEEQTNESQST